MAKNGKSAKEIYRHAFLAGMGNVCGLFQPISSRLPWQTVLLHDMGKVQHDFQTALRKHIEGLTSEQRRQVKQMLLSIPTEAAHVPLPASRQEIVALEE